MKYEVVIKGKQLFTQDTETAFEIAQSFGKRVGKKGYLKYDYERDGFAVNVDMKFTEGLDYPTLEKM